VNDVDHDMLGNFSWCLVEKQRKIRKRKRKNGTKQRRKKKGKSLTRGTNWIWQNELEDDYDWSDYSYSGCCAVG
jgi:hypothetical protein